MVCICTGETERRAPQDAVLGDQQMAYFAVNRHQSRSAKGQQHALAGALAQIRCRVQELQHLQSFATVSLFISVARPWIQPASVRGVILFSCNHLFLLSAFNSSVAMNGEVPIHHPRYSRILAASMFFCVNSTAYQLG